MADQRPTSPAEGGEQEVAANLLPPDQDAIAVKSGRDPELIVSYVLRVGVYSSAALLIVGIILYLISVLGQGSDWRTTINDVGQHSQRYRPDQLLAALSRFEPLAIIELGVIVLVLTPIVRVATTVLIFVRERDRLYVGITLVVLAVLLLGWLGLGGGH